ncbi:MAG: hypothetical protein HC896_16805 [Bacteroidales bacterium]|nr:hypothetical protein [Bacteroidales bacterium]
MMEKSNGEIWVGTNNGLHIKSSTSWASYSTVDGLPGNTVISIAESKYGTMWILTPEGAASISGSQIVTFAF